MRFSRVVSILSLSIFCAFVLVILSSWATRHAIGGGKRFSNGFRQAILALAEFPTQAKGLLGLLGNYFPPKGSPDPYKGYHVMSSGSNSITGFLLVSCITTNGVNRVSLINLSNSVERFIDIPTASDRSIGYSDILVGSEPRRQSAFSSRHRVWNPYLSKDGVLTYMIPWNDLISIDLKTGQEQWRVQGAFHHSIEPNADGDLWVCGAVEPEAIGDQKSGIRHSNRVFDDQALVKVSKSGKILQVISVADILSSSGLEYLLYGSSNPNVNYDPIHLNQITPILRDSGVFRKGQLLVSLRNLSAIILVDPDSRSVVWNKSGNWMNQHCVMPIAPSTFTVLDNHSFASGQYWLNPNWRTRIVQYNIETGHSSEIEIDKKNRQDLHIPIEGRALPIATNSWLIEDSIAGTIMIFQNQEMVYKWTNNYSDGIVGVVSWCRHIPEGQVPKNF